MGLFNGLSGLFKPRIVNEIRDGVWGHLVHDHGLTVDTLSKNIRCVKKRLLFADEFLPLRKRFHHRINQSFNTDMRWSGIPGQSS
jgi:hypothetical protein